MAQSGSAGYTTGFWKCRREMGAMLLCGLEIKNPPHRIGLSGWSPSICVPCLLLLNPLRAQQTETHA